MGYKSDYKEIKSHVEYLKKKYKFVGPLHFTDISNLKNIFESGYLYSRNVCENNGIDFVDGANHSVLNKASENVHKCVRFYYRGKTPTLYDNEGIKLKQYCNEVHIPIPVFLVFDEELLYLDDTVFSNGNATSSHIGNTAKFFKEMDWDTIFHCTWFSQEEKYYIVNKRQAELLSINPVSITYIKEILFRCEADKKRAVNLYSNDFKYRVDSNMFSDKNNKECKNKENYNNFIKDYEIKFNYDNNKNKTSLIVHILYQKPLDGYITTYSIFDMNGDYVDEDKMEVQVLSDKEIEFSLFGDTSNWFKLEVYLNNVLYIEEFLIKYDFMQHDIFFKKLKTGKEVMFLNIIFSNLSYHIYKHRYEIIDDHNKILAKEDINYKKESESLEWHIKFKKYDDNWYKLKYYINDVICISDTLEEQSHVTI